MKTVSNSHIKTCRFFHYELQATVREMEGGIYEKMSQYLSTLARY